MNQSSVISIIFGSLGIVTFSLSYYQTAKRDARAKNREEFINTSSIITNIDFIKKQLELLGKKITNIEDKLEDNAIATNKLSATLEERFKTIFNRIDLLDREVDELEKRIRSLENGKQN